MTLQLSPLTARLVLKNSNMNLRLLATDPDPVLLQIYRTYFSNFGYDVATARDAVECAEVLNDFGPDAMVISLELSGGADGMLSVIHGKPPAVPIATVLTVSDLNRLKSIDYLSLPDARILEAFRLRDLRRMINTLLRNGTDGQQVSQDDGARNALASTGATLVALGHSPHSASTAERLTPDAHGNGIVRVR